MNERCIIRLLSDFSIRSLRAFRRPEGRAAREYSVPPHGGLPANWFREILTSMSLKTFRRLFDDGRSILIDTGVPDGLVTLGMTSCTSPDCPCREATLRCSRVRRSPTGRLGQPGTAIEGLLAVDSGSLSIPPETSAVEPELADLLRRALRPDVIERLRARWHRIKGLERDDEWQRVDWKEIDLDSMVPFMDMFPSRWDLSVVLDRRRYWALDLWCLARHCSCAEVAVEFLDDEGRSAGSIRFDVERFSVIEMMGQDARLRPLCEALLDDPSQRRELRSRRKLARRVSRELPQHLASLRASQAAPGPGRNTSCPCGSGQKYKRCCGR